MSTVDKRFLNTANIYKLRRVIGARIKEARQFRGKTQKWLADEVGIKQSSVSAWEVCKTDPSTDNLSTIARVLQVNFEWLATGNGPMEGLEYTPVAFRVSEPKPALDEDAQELLTLFGELPKSKRKVLLAFVRGWVNTK